MNQTDLIDRIALLEDVLDDAARLIEHQSGYVPVYIYAALLDMPRHRDHLDAMARMERLDRWLERSGINPADLQVIHSTSSSPH